jgi:hypothetical protein
MRNRWSARLVLLGLCLVWQDWSCAQAGPLYVYTDAQGQAILTDNPQQVPPEFRGRLRTLANGEAPAPNVPLPVAEPAVVKPASSGLIGDILSLVAAKVGSRQIKGLTAYQTAVMIVAGFCWLALLVMIFLSANPAIRLLCKFLLVLIGVAAVYHLTVGGTIPIGTVAGSPQQGAEQAMDNLLGKMKSKTEQSYRAQDERTARQLDPVDQPTR